MKVAALIRNLIPYVAGKPIDETKREFGLSEVVKLASNENPLGPSPKALQAIQAALPELHRYPDPAAAELKKRMSAFLHIPPEFLTFGNGSDEIIDLMLRVYCSEGGRVLLFEKSFAAYKIAAHASNIEVDEVTLRPQYQMNLDDMAEKFRPDQHRLIFIINPNNPTGAYLTSQEIEKFLNRIGRSTDNLVVLDEAYFEFVQRAAGDDTLALLNRYPNLVILRTMSKAYGLAGIRIGTMIAHPNVVDYINRTRKPFNVNSLAQVAAIAALDDQEHVRKTVALTHSGLVYLRTELEKLGLSPLPSQGNFLTFETSYDSMVIFTEMLKLGVILRPLKNYGFDRHLRISVGTTQENQTAIHALAQVLRDRQPRAVIQERS